MRGEKLWTNRKNQPAWIEELGKNHSRKIRQGRILQERKMQKKYHSRKIMRDEFKSEKQISRKYLPRKNNSRKKYLEDSNVRKIFNCKTKSCKKNDAR